MNRRKFLGGVGSLTVMSTAGCFDSGLSAETFSYSSNPVTAPEFIRSQTGLSHIEMTDNSIVETIEYQNDSQDVTFTEWLTTFKNPDASTFEHVWVHTQPVREVGDVTLKPRTFDHIYDFVEYIDGDWKNITIDIPDMTREMNIFDISQSVQGYIGAIDTETNGLSEINIQYVTLQKDDEEITILSIVPENSDSKSSVLALLQLLEHPATNTTITDDVDANETESDSDME